METNVNVEINADLLAEALAHRILKSNREMSKLTGRLAAELLKSSDFKLTPMVETAIANRVREEFNSLLQQPRYGLQSPQTAVDTALRTLSSDFMKELRALAVSKIHNDVDALIRAELQSRMSTFTNDELLRLIGK